MDFLNLCFHHNASGLNAPGFVLDLANDNDNMVGIQSLLVSPTQSTSVSKRLFRWL